MMTVRFATGFSVQYNTGGYVCRGESYTDIYDKKGGNWLAQVPNGALIEVVAPCRTYNAAKESIESELKAQIDLLRKEVRSLTRKIRK
jgi:hypothetical protein